MAVPQIARKIASLWQIPVRDNAIYPNSERYICNASFVKVRGLCSRARKVEERIQPVGVRRTYLVHFHGHLAASAVVKFEALPFGEPIA